MDFEIRSFIKVWIITTTCLCYCYYIASRIPRGIKRLISLFPIFYLFLVLPLKLQSFHLGAPTTFFLVWLGFFKLLLFSFELGPLSPTPPSKLFHFICIASLPIKIKHTSPNIEKPLTTKSTTYPSYQNGQKTQKPLGIEIVLALCVVPARILFGFEIEPQFNEPYLSSSLQDFWGRRWNLMVTSILRPTVYGPIRHISTSIVGRKWAPLPAVVSTFAVSGLMHEIIYYYLTRVRPTWEVTWFFVLHGVCTAIEIVVKKAVTGSWRLNKAVSGPLTLGFLAVTGNWLFFPQLLRNGVHEKAIFRLELQPPSDEPYLSTSLQDFWGRRWNLMATNALRQTIYKPVRTILGRLLGSQLATSSAVLASFVVSGLMHELIYYYMIRVSPTWEVTCFFVLHGACLVAEIGLKKAFSKNWRLHRAISGPLTLGFVAATGFWLFFPPLVRNGADKRAIKEFKALGEFLMEKLKLA